MKKTILLLWCLFGTLLYNNAQDINTDRPDVTESYYTVPRNSLQIETGYMFEKSTDFKEINHTYNTTLLRYGLVDNLELRFNIAYMHSKGIEGNPMSNYGWGDMQVGLKFYVLDQDKFLPYLSLLFHYVIPTGDNHFSPDASEPIVKILGGWEFDNGSSISFNAGAIWTAGNDNVEYSASVAYGQPIIKETLSAFIEYFDYTSHNSDKMHHYMDLGVTYLLKENLQLDLSVGTNLKGFRKGYFISAGASYLISFSK
ncbi:transporter [Halosquirtibacter xylanolyticus]|uniref:transporter n=1 Tax=Halosquirtibacter xylanolyticus TaxID=3374599 RepID=UPI00374986CB|nr:transporter [Prolixibacteraceae bacterium]